MSDKEVSELEKTPEWWNDNANNGLWSALFNFRDSLAEHPKGRYLATRHQAFIDSRDFLISWLKADVEAYVQRRIKDSNQSYTTGGQLKGASKTIRLDVNPKSHTYQNEGKTPDHLINGSDGSLLQGEK